MRPARSRGRHDRLGVGGRLRHRLLDEAVLARLEHADRELRVGRHRGRERDGVDGVVGQHLVEVGGEAGAREQRARRARGWRRTASQHQRQLGIRQAAKLRAMFGPQ